MGINIIVTQFTGLIYICFSCMTQLTSLYYLCQIMYDSVQGPISSIDSDVTQFTGLHFPMLNHVRLSSRAYMKLWLSSRAWMSYAKSCMTQFRDLAPALNKMYELWLSSRASFPYFKSLWLSSRAYTSFDSVHEPTIPMPNHIWISSLAYFFITKSCMSHFTSLYT